MKILLTEKEAQQVELAALQKLVQDKIQNLIEARCEEMNRELNTDPDTGGTYEGFQGEPEYTLKDIHLKFLGSKSVIDTQSAQKSLLIPAGVDVSKVKV